MADDEQLSPREARFVEEYLVDLSAGAAARRAGYTPSNSRNAGMDLMRRHRVIDAIEAAVAARSKRTQVTIDRVVEELAKIGFANMADFLRVTEGGDAYVDLSALTRDQAAALAEVTIEEVAGRGDEGRDIKRTKIKLLDKRSALVDLGKHLGMFPDRVEHTGKDGGPIQIANMTDEQLDARLALLLGGGSGDEVGGGD